MTTTDGMPPGAPKKDSIGAASKKREARQSLHIVVAVVIVGIFIAFVIANRGRVPVHFVFFVSSVSLIWVLVVTALLGAVADRFLVWRKGKKRRQGTTKSHI